MIDLEKMQEEVKAWCDYNFPLRTSWMPLLGVQEEVGELSHHFLKRADNIRINENHEEKMKDAVGDIILFLLNFCGLEGFSLEKELVKAWDEVKKRDWKNYPTNGIDK
jgi:NTP pyrophosphatase (non-canonical NTP hydrolase)